MSYANYPYGNPGLGNAGMMMMGPQGAPFKLSEEAIVSRLVDRAISSVGRGEVCLFKVTDVIDTEARAILAEGAADVRFVSEIVMSAMPFVATLLSGGVTEEEIKTYLSVSFPGKENTINTMKLNPWYTKYFELNSFIITCNKTLKKPVPPAQAQQNPAQAPPPRKKVTRYKYEGEEAFEQFTQEGTTVYMRKSRYFNGDREVEGYELYNPREPESRYPMFLHNESEPETKHDYITIEIVNRTKLISQNPLNRYCIIRGDPFYIIKGKNVARFEKN